MTINSLNPIQVSGLSTAKFNYLIEQLGHLGLTVTPTENGYEVIGQEIAGTLGYNPTSATLTAELHQFPGIVTPGHLVGRLYDAIISLP